MYRTGEISTHRACCEQATQHYSLGRGGTIFQDSRPASYTTRSPRIVTECLHTRSMLIKTLCTWYLQSYTCKSYMYFINQKIWKSCITSLSKAICLAVLLMFSLDPLWTAKALVRLHWCAGSPEPCVCIYAIIALFAWRSSSVKRIHFYSRESMTI